MARIPYLALVVFGALTVAAPAIAQDYPNRAIKIVVPLAPAGAPDLVARIVGQRLSERFGQPVVVENRAGANGTIGGEQVARSAPDGYTLLLPQDSLMVVNPHIYSKMAFDPLKDVVPVAMLASNLFFLSVTTSLPINSFQDFVALAKSSNPPLLYGSAGNGSQHQLAMEMLKQRAGINLQHVPYRGATPAATAVMTGEVAAMFSGGSTAPLIKSGKLRALAVAGNQRSKQFPDLPTIAEFYPDYEIRTWFALFAPAGTPDAVLSKLRGEIGEIIKEPDVIKKLADAGGIEPHFMAADEFSALLRDDHRRFGILAKAIDLKSN